MPTLGNALDFAKYEGRNFRGHQLGAAPSSPVTGQVYYNTADNTLYWWDGTVWQSGKGGGASGNAGGDLQGTYPNPQIAAGAIVNADVNAAAAIAYAKLALTNSIVSGDIVDGTLVNADISPTAAIALSKLAVDPLARANHTGTQLANTISNFDAQVRTSRLDQMAAPTAAVNANGQLINGLADPVLVTDAANKRYVDNTTQGLDAKASVRAASIGNVALAAPGAAIDGVTLNNGDRVLLKNQTAPAENGIYNFNGAAAAMTRDVDANAWAELPGAFTWVEEGTTLKDTGWVCTVDQGGTLGTTAVTWVQFSGAGSYIGGNGLSLTGNTFDVNVDNSSIEINADILRVKAAGITDAMLNKPKAGYYSSATHGAGTTITITAATHGLGAKRGIQVQVQDEATGAVEIPDMVVAANGDVTVTYGTALTANTKRVTLTG